VVVTVVVVVLLVITNLGESRVAFRDASSRGECILFKFCSDLEVCPLL
jgi:hypothetical protein